MKKIVLAVFLIFLFLYPIPYTLYPSHADEIEDLQKQINELSSAREQSIKATKPLEGQLDSLKRQLAQIQAQLDNLSASIKQKEKDLEAREEKLVELTTIFNGRVWEDYKNSYIYNPLGFIFGQSKLTDKLYHQKTINENREIIKIISSEIINVLTDKEKLEKDKASMASLQAQVDKNADFLGGEVKKAKAYQAQLSSKIVALSARQQQIISQRQASLNLPSSLGAGPLFCTDDRNLNPGFSPAFAFFTYGIPHRVGMNQYGAYGRAKAGQSHEDILKAYFDNFNFETKPNINISVSGYGSMPLETYLLGIYEMPESWPLEALKAQAIAARSYALAYTGSGAGEICTTQACQVYKNSPKSGAWKDAVEQTSGKTMISGGSPVKAWYSSTDGGYTFASSDVWGSGTSFTKRTRDTTGAVSSFSELQSLAYDKDSPCFYAAQGYRNEYGKSAWLKSTELADIVNTLLLVKADSGTAEHLYQTDKPNPAGTENWDEEKVKTELRSRGGTPFSNISDVSISADFSSGMVSSINVSGDGGSQSFNGGDFKNRFNLRAPANIQIVGPLFNVETK